jgi:hypothetical protein
VRDKERERHGRGWRTSVPFIGGQGGGGRSGRSGKEKQPELIAVKALNALSSRGETNRLRWTSGGVGAAYLCTGLGSSRGGRIRGRGRVLARGAFRQWRWNTAGVWTVS